MSRSKRPKGKARPRWYHHSRSQGPVNADKIARALPAFERAEADMAEVAAAAREHRRSVSDREAILDAVVHVSPAIPRPLERLL